MKRAFIRGLWGVYSHEDTITQRRFKMDNDINKVLKNKYQIPFTTYVFGSENERKLKDFGISDIKLIDKNSNPYNLSLYQYRHKLDILKLAMEDFDEIIYIDWDCEMKKSLPLEFWNIMGKREYVQANLQQYKVKKCLWRGQTDTRKLPNAGFLYIRDKNFPDEIIKFWEKSKGNSAEPPLAQAMDERSGGWVGMDKYWDLYEPDFCNLWQDSVYDKKKLKEKDQCFIHYQGIPSYRYLPK